MATPNYSYEKRQRELAKKRKKEDKLRSKTAPKPGDGGEPQAESPSEFIPIANPPGSTP